MRYERGYKVRYGRPSVRLPKARVRGPSEACPSVFEGTVVVSVVCIAGSDEEKSVFLDVQ